MSGSTRTSAARSAVSFCIDRLQIETDSSRPSWRLPVNDVPFVRDGVAVSEADLFSGSGLCNGTVYEGNAAPSGYVRR